MLTLGCFLFPWFSVLKSLESQSFLKYQISQTHLILFLGILHTPTSKIYRSIGYEIHGHLDFK